MSKRRSRAGYQSPRKQLRPEDETGDLPPVEDDDEEVEDDVIGPSQGHCSLASPLRHGSSQSEVLLFFYHGAK